MPQGIGDDNRDLFKAAYSQDWPQVKHLIRGGANLNSRNEDGFSLLDFAISCGADSIIKLWIMDEALYNSPLEKN